MRRLIVVVIVSVMSLGLVAIGGAAHATFPGPNGRIAFITAKGRCCNISTMEPDGSAVQQLTHMPRGYRVVDPSWSPGGSQLVFSKQKLRGAYTAQLWVMDADGGNQRKLLRDPFFRDNHPSYSPDGTRIVFTRCRPDFEACAVYRIRADGKGLTALTSLQGPHVLDLTPAYSPDGATIAFYSSGRGGVDNAIYLMNADGSGVRRLTPARLRAGEPDWAPDGSRLVFTAPNRVTGHTAVWTINADGTDLQEITFPGQRFDFTPSYAPAGDKIAFERDSSDFSKAAVWVMNPDGSALEKIRGNLVGEPRWGPAP